jgi:hypothetical protein
VKLFLREEYIVRLALVGAFTDHRTVGTDRTDPIDADHVVPIGGGYRSPHMILIFFSHFLKFIKNIENSKKYIVSYS